MPLFFRFLKPSRYILFSTSSTGYVSDELLTNFFIEIRLQSLKVVPGRREKRTNVVRIVCKLRRVREAHSGRLNTTSAVVDTGRSEGERVVVFISQGDKVGVAWLLGTDVNFNTPESISLPPPSSYSSSPPVSSII
jgi:hypothetical protein